MSWSCGCSVHRAPVASPSRRSVLGLMGAACLTGLPGFASAAPTGEPPKPANVLSPDAALNRLMTGNRRYVSGQTSIKDYASTRGALLTGQNPYACLLGCADSRVGPELCFDESSGDLFVTRVAGNYLTSDILASLEYGTTVLQAPLVMVLGHTQCGAVAAAVTAYEQEIDFPGHIQNIATAIAPAVRSAAAQPRGAATLVELATLENIRQNVTRLELATPLISRRVRDGKLKIVGGLSDLETGRVDLMV